MLGVKWVGSAVRPRTASCFDSAPVFASVTRYVTILVVGIVLGGGPVLGGECSGSAQEVTASCYNIVALFPNNAFFILLAEGPE